LSKAYSFTLVGGREITASKDEIDFFITTKLSNNFYWRFNNMLDKETLNNFFNERLTELTKLRQISYYILFYSENLCFTSYLYVKAVDGERKAKEYMKHHKKLLKELRKLHKQNEKISDVRKLRRNLYKMIFKALEYAIDPF